MHTTPGPPPPPSPVRQSSPGRLGRMLIALFALVLLTLLIGAEYLLHNAEPLLRKRITETLSARFGAPVTLDALGISLLSGLQVEGTGLRIGLRTGTVPTPPDHPMIQVDRFQFRTGLLSLLREGLLHHPTHIAFVRVQGLEVHIATPGTSAQPEPRLPHPSEDLAVLIDQLQCRDVKLFLESSKPDPTRTTANGRIPREFRISALDLRHVGPHRAMLYDAELINPRPVGAIHIHGHFGPWAGAQANDNLTDNPNSQPGQTPLDGEYTFDHADLGTIRGLGGTLSSTGHFAGTLNRLTLDGHTDTPNFSLGIADHPMPLHTDFHATVDGTTGDTYLTPVHAWLAGSAFTATGEVVDVKGFGHDIQLDLDIPHGRMQDFLRLAVKTSPPLLSGTLTLHARLHIPPGPTPVPQKLSLAGTFNLASAQFSNPRWQAGIDNLSNRASGHPEQATGTQTTGTQATGTQDIRDTQATKGTQTRSDITAHFTLDHGILSVADLHYSFPGALMLMNGVYSTDGKLFEFRGHVRTAATASAMVGGWKGLLLSPFDHYLQKNGAGVELPVEVSGTAGDIHLGLALAGADDAPAQLLTDLRAKTAAAHQLHDARGLTAQAAAEDAAAAGAGTLEDAQRHHNNAVRLRAEAQAEAPQPHP